MASLPWWSFGAVAIRTGGHPHIFYGHIQDAGKGVTPDREHHAMSLLARDATIEDVGVALVAWRTICSLKSLGRLGIRHFRRTTTALLSKWASHIIQQFEDLAVVVLRGSYVASIDWTLCSTPRRGDSAFMQGLRPVFTCMQSLFQPCVGNDASFNF